MTSTLHDVRQTDRAVGINPEVLALSDLRGRVVYRPGYINRLPMNRLDGIAMETVGQNLGVQVLDLTARHPYADAGYADFYQPGRWDCESDLVYMESIHQTGSSPGEWDGTAAYARFKPAQTGTYIVVVNFSGYQQTMSLYGPWGTTTAYCATTSDSAATTAIWNGTAGQSLFCTFSSRADSGYSGIAYLLSFQIFKAA
ncbi:hypothetical protein [Mycobacterium mantenii]|uniref:Uncharacterized protein n=1 Tax=Mycobacterium mantenii TaxID=560555 RepID=A0A1A2T5B8_MYCNT|nr:hypothetical protein [Mycobacterium mantenii]OBH40401.1 hypothetical protein A5688_19445 [Mycobacterium mantenii]OBH51416.1 hypothetical protein A5687_11010 [Mycobacterium mantenii]OBH71232.1 hypothetical protein A5682_08820 [Mycobacterium mantenii]OBH76821.1 hypothetical protein A5683_20545 [Mycobacterium mantenii]